MSKYAIIFILMFYAFKSCKTSPDRYKVWEAKGVLIRDSFFMQNDIDKYNDFAFNTYLNDSIVNLLIRNRVFRVGNKSISVLDKFDINIKGENIRVLNITPLVDTNLSCVMSGYFITKKYGVVRVYDGKHRIIYYLRSIIIGKDTIKMDAINEKYP